MKVKEKLPISPTDQYDKYTPSQPRGTIMISIILNNLKDAGVGGSPNHIPTN